MDQRAYTTYQYPPQDDTGMSPAEEWPSSHQLRHRDAAGPYDERGFLINFEQDATAFTSPRKAPKPPLQSPPAAAVGVSVSAHEEPVLRDEHQQQLCLRTSAAVPAPAASVTSSTSSRTSPASPNPGVRFSDAYRQWWLQQYREPPTVSSTNQRDRRPNRQGYWLARGTMRGAGDVTATDTKGRGQGHWLARGTMADACETPAGGKTHSENPVGLWRRLTRRN